MNGKVNKSILKASGIAALVMVAALALCGIFELAVLGMKNSLGALGAGKRWSADGDRYAVVGLYAEEDAGIVWDNVGGWVRSIDAGLLEASVTPNEGARSWAWCSGADVLLSVQGTKGTVNAETLAVSGDFFVFHPLKFVYGGGFLNDDSNPMGVVLDRDLAWRVYGAENIVGMTVTVGGEEFTIVGITDRESDSAAYKKAYGDVPRMYMNYAGYAKIGEKNVTLFEAALPNSVRGFAMNIFTGAVRPNESATAVIEATDRFSLKNRFENMKQLSYAWVSVNKIEYPYWENEARVMDYRAAVMMLFEVGLAAVAGTALLTSFILLRVSGWTLTAEVKRLWQKAGEKRKQRLRDKPAKVPKPKKEKKPKEPKKSKKPKTPENAAEPEEDEPILPDPADPAQPDEPGTIPEKEAD